ncbi:hypothetical protein M514_27719 [Trichuris suis]|uniref:Uncharacterized protein n=1 Tax=Trichuris suis TaxID=68888 RepID=A0A085MSA7_9BILA|nr:hypothetical protein M514_27719 [Trichuris suis]
MGVRHLEVPGNCVHYSDEEQREESGALMYTYYDWEGFRFPCAGSVFVDHFYPVYIFVRDIVFSESKPYGRVWQCVKGFLEVEEGYM